MYHISHACIINNIHVSYITYTCAPYIHAVHTQCTHAVMHISHHIYAVHRYSAYMQRTHTVHTRTVHRCHMCMQCTHTVHTQYKQCIHAVQTRLYLSVLCEWAYLCKLSPETMRTLKVFPDFWHETETILGVRNLMGNQLYMLVSF